MKAIDLIKEYESLYGNLDFKTYNRESMGCEMLENAEKEKLDLINKYELENQIEKKNYLQISLFKYSKYVWHF